MNQKELNKILKLHGKFLRGEKDGVKANLRGADLRRATLRYANLSGADLRGADLRGADLRDADLRRTDLRDADLSGADLRCANLSGADLRGADLRGADLRGADLSGADLDFSVLPLWCGSLQFKLDEENLRRLTYHLLSLLEHNEVSFRNAKEFANNWEGVKRHDIRKIGDK